MKTPNNKWEESFLQEHCDEFFENPSIGDLRVKSHPTKIIVFIRSLLHFRDEELVREIEGAKRKMVNPVPDSDEVIGYNDGLEAAIEIIKKRE